MNSEERDVSYGFAPQGRPGQKRAERPGAPKEPQEGRKAAAAEYPVPAPSSPKAYWAWLCIGILLGAGMTLLGSSLWLQGNYVNPSVAMATDPSETTVPHQGVGGPVEKSPANVASTDGRTKPPAAQLIYEAKRLEDAAGGDVGSTKFARDDVQAKPAPRPVQTATKVSSPVEQVKANGPNETELLLVNEPAAEPVIGNEAKTSAVTTAEEVQRRVKEARERAKAILNNDVLISRESGLEATPQGTPQVKSDSQEGAPSTNAVPTANRTVQVVKAGEYKATSAPSTAQTTEKKVAVVAKATTPKRSPSGRIYRVQLAAVDDESAAETFWQDVRTRLPGLFSGIEPTFDRGEVDERIFYRIWVGEFDKRGDADDYCGQLKSSGQDCFVTRG